MVIPHKFNRARTECQSFPGGDLAIVNTVAINEGLRLLTDRGKRYWIGLKDMVGDNTISDYVWLATGQSVSTGNQFWSYLYPKYPHHQCIYGQRILISDPFTWRDQNCHSTNKFICQRPFNLVNSTSIYPSAIDKMVSSSGPDFSIQFTSQLISSTLANQINITSTNVINKLESMSRSLDLTDEFSQMNAPSFILSSNIKISLTISVDEMQLSDDDTSQTSGLRLTPLSSKLSANVSSLISVTAIDELWLSNISNSQSTDIYSSSLSLMASVNILPISIVDGLFQSDFNTSQFNDINSQSSSLELSISVIIPSTAIIGELQQSDFKTIDFIDDNRRINPTVLPSSLVFGTNIISSPSTNQLKILASPDMDFSISTTAYQIIVKSSSLLSIFTRDNDVIIEESTTVISEENLSSNEHHHNQAILSAVEIDRNYKPTSATILVNELDSITDILNAVPSMYKYTINNPNVFTFCQFILKDNFQLTTIFYIMVF